MKTNKFLLLGALSLICSCVNNKYDLNLDISKDVKIEGNKVTLPFGSLKLVTLDSLIDVDDIDVLEKSTDGTYSITKGDSISTITETVDPIEISVDGQKETVDIEFTDAEIDEVEIKATDVDPATFSAPTISFEELNNSLPNLRADASQKVESDGLKEKLELLAGLGGSGNETFSIEEIGLSGTSHKINSVVEYGNEEMRYELPEDVKSVSKIELATTLENDELDTNGTLIKAKITRPKAMTDAVSTISFRIEFPKRFVLTLKDKNNEHYKLVGNNIIEVEELPVTSDETFVEFYIKDIVDVEELTIENGRVISFENMPDIIYTLDYNMKSGNITIDMDELDDVEKYIEENFTFNI